MEWQVFPLCGSGSEIADNSCTGHVGAYILRRFAPLFQHAAHCKGDRFCGRENFLNGDEQWRVADALSGAGFHAEIESRLSGFPSFASASLRCSNPPAGLAGAGSEQLY